MKLKRVLSTIVLFGLMLSSCPRNNPIKRKGTPAKSTDDLEPFISTCAYNAAALAADEALEYATRVINRVTVAVVAPASELDAATADTLAASNAKHAIAVDPANAAVAFATNADSTYVAALIAFATADRFAEAAALAADAAARYCVHAFIKINGFPTDLTEATTAIHAALAAAALAANAAANSKTVNGNLQRPNNYIGCVNKDARALALAEKAQVLVDKFKSEVLKG